MIEEAEAVSLLLLTTLGGPDTEHCGGRPQHQNCQKQGYGEPGPHWQAGWWVGGGWEVGVVLGWVRGGWEVGVVLEWVRGGW